MVIPIKMVKENYRVKQHNRFKEKPLYITPPKIYGYMTS